MANLKDVMAFLVDRLATALPGVDVGSSFPPRERVAMVPQGKPLVAVIHRTTSFMDNYKEYEHSIDDPPLSIKSTLSDFSLAGGQSKTLTLSFQTGETAVRVGDAVSCQLINGDYNNAAIASADLVGETLSTLATKLAADINETLDDANVSATASGAVVTITNNGTFGYRMVSNCGNQLTINIAVKDALRNLQLNVWCSDEDLKETLNDTIESTLALLERDKGFYLDSGEYVAFNLNGAKPGYDDVPQDIYLDQYIFTVKHVLTVADIAYEILAGIGTPRDYP